MFASRTRSLWLMSLRFFSIPTLVSAKSVIFRSPINRVHGQGSEVEYSLFHDIDIRWSSDYTPLTCDVYQQDPETGVEAKVNIFDKYANTTTQPFKWRARNLPNISAESPMWFHMYWSQNSSCAGCQTFTTNFTLFNPNGQDKESHGDNSLTIGLGIGLGVGIPILILATIGAWWMRRRKHRRLAATQQSDHPSQEHMDPDNRHTDITAAPPYNDGSTDNGRFSDGFKSGQERSIAELGESIYELSPNQQIHEAEPMSAKAEPRELP